MRRDYQPFGQEINLLNNASNTHKYTGKEFDTETGLYYYGARYYDPAIGRFISVDPAGGKPDNPQTWNRYVYTLNNPYKYVDPDGREAYLTSHALVGEYRHSAILLVPEDQSRDWGALGFKK